MARGKESHVTLKYDCKYGGVVRSSSSQSFFFFFFLGRPSFVFSHTPPSPLMRYIPRTTPANLAGRVSRLGESWVGNARVA